MKTSSLKKLEVSQKFQNILRYSRSIVELMLMFRYFLMCYVSTLKKKVWDFRSETYKKTHFYSRSWSYPGH